MRGRDSLPAALSLNRRETRTHMQSLAIWGTVGAKGRTAYGQGWDKLALSIFIQLNTGSWAVRSSRSSMSTVEKIKAAKLCIIYSSQPKIDSLLVCIQVEAHLTASAVSV